MGKTYKRLPFGYFRSPKGHKNCLSEYVLKEDDVPSLRYRTIPPNSWEDISFDKQVWMPYQACENMLAKGLKDKEIIEKLIKKFHLSSFQARRIIEIKKRIFR